MKNLFISNLNLKDVEHFTSNFGLNLRKSLDKIFKKMCNHFTNVNIIRIPNNALTDDEYFCNISQSSGFEFNYNIDSKKNNIILERYPNLEKDESYIFVANHTCPEDIETILNILDRNAYLVLGSIETLKYNPESYLLWLNGMIPFDIMNDRERKQLIPKMERVLKSNSILIFPEGSHNYSPNNLVNKLFDGAVNLSLKTGKKIVVVTLIRDQEKNISYIDVCNPIDLNCINVEIQNKNDNIKENEKEYVKYLSSCIRDKMATAVFHIISRHFDLVERNKYDDIEQYFRQLKIDDAFKKMNWKRDVFDAEYLVKKSKEEIEYEEVVKKISDLKYSYIVLKNTLLDNREYILLSRDLDRKNVASCMRNYWLEKNYNQNTKKFIKRK